MDATVVEGKPWQILPFWIYKNRKLHRETGNKNSAPVWSTEKQVRIFRTNCFVFLLQISVPPVISFEGWNFNSGNYLFTTDTK